VFTGLVAATVRVLSAGERRGGVLLEVERPASFGDVVPGESIAVSGVCLTALEERGRLAFEVSPETLRRTTLERLVAGSRVNLERALAAGDRLGGHIVAGHVDAVTGVSAITPQGDFWTFTFDTARDWERYVVEKGSIALDGVSLTVAVLRERSFDVAVIPHTFAATTLGGLRPGEPVNVEVDVLGKYVERLLGARLPSADERIAKLLS
jgi:riboflavin synthase